MGSLSAKSASRHIRSTESRLSFLKSFVQIQRRLWERSTCAFAQRYTSSSTPVTSATTSIPHIADIYYAARAVRLLIPLAREHGINPLWLTCDPDNVASRRSCERAGAQFVDIVDVPAACIIHRSGHTKKCRYRLDL